MRKPIRIGDTVYPSKKAAGDAIRKVLYSYSIGATLSDDDAAFLADVLKLHPERDTKVGVGVRSFQAQQNDGSSGFWLTRTDGTRTDFSFISGLTPPTPEMEARAGFRSEVRDQIASFRDDAFANCTTVACAVTGDAVRAATAHVDHNPPFDDLVNRFCTNVGILLSAVQVEPTRDGETTTRIADRSLATAWSGFHRENARLRIVSVRANLSLLRRRN